MARSQKRAPSRYALALASTTLRKRRLEARTTTGLVVLTPRTRHRITRRGFDLVSWKWAGGKPVEESPVAVEARSAEHRRQRTASFFRQPKWTVDLVLSWIGYRDPNAIDIPFAPTLYKGSRPKVEERPRLVLLHALQRGDLRAIRQRGKLVDRIHPDEWFAVLEQWSVDLWPECVFSRVDVIALWPGIPAVVEHELVGGKGTESVVVQRVEPEPILPKTSADHSKLKANKTARARQAIADRTATTKRIIWEQVRKVGRSDLDHLLAAVRTEQSNQNIKKPCSLRMLRQALTDKTEAFENNITETSITSVL